MSNKNLNMILRDSFLDYINNYLTVEKFAEHNELSTMQAIKLLELSKEVHEQYVLNVFENKLDNK